MSPGRPVVVVGGGWAGLAAAVELGDRGVPVTVLEAAPHLGGRARTVSYRGRPLDNGQHLLIGACDATLDLLRRVGVAPDALMRLPFRLEMRGLQGPDVDFGAPPWLGSTARWAGALLAARGLPVADRLRAAARLPALPAPLPGETVATWLIRGRQPASLIRALWHPLCTAALNTRPHEASATLLHAVMDQAFRGRGSDLLVPARRLSDLLPGAAAAYLGAAGSRVITGSRVTGLGVANGQVISVETRDGPIRTDRVILAVPPDACRRLLQCHAPCTGLVNALARLTASPITTVYLHYPPDVTLPRPILGLLDGLGQWAFDRRICGEPGTIAVVVSADGPHMALDNDTLAARIGGELSRCFPAWPRPLTVDVIRERRATFAAVPGAAHYRPGLTTPLGGCWLAGDYVATGLPATLEGAVRSGLSAAATVHRHSAGDPCRPAASRPSSAGGA